MLYMIGVGLSSIRDISCKAKEIVDACDSVYLEAYTSVLLDDEDTVKEFIGEFTYASRDMVEHEETEIIRKAKTQDVAFLVVGDVFGATTHTDLFLRAKHADIPVRILHNASVLTAVGISGLELYKFGKTTSMVFFDEDWRPATAYETLRSNLRSGLHTLILLDIKTAEPSRDDLKRGVSTPQPPRFMTIREGIGQMLEIEDLQGAGIFSKETLVVGCARLGSEDPHIYAGSAGEVAEHDFGRPLHCLIVPGNLHYIEEEALEMWK